MTKITNSEAYSRYINVGVGAIELRLNSSIERFIACYYVLEEGCVCRLLGRVDLVREGRSLITATKYRGSRKEVYCRLLRLINAKVAQALQDSGNVRLVRAATLFRRNGSFLLETDKNVLPEVLLWHLSKRYLVHSSGWTALKRSDGTILPLTLPVEISLSDVERIRVVGGVLHDKSVSDGLSVFFPSMSEGAWGPIIARPKFAVRLEFRSNCKPRLVCRMGTRPASTMLFETESPAPDVLKEVPGLVIQFGSVQDLDGVLDHIEDLLLGLNEGSSEVHRILDFLAPTREGSGESSARRPPQPTPLLKKNRFSIGMSTYDDYDGVYFSIQSLRMYHPEAMREAEIIVVDNNPLGRCADALKALEVSVENYRYIPFTDAQGTAAAKEQVMTAASGDFVLQMDSHVMIVPGAVSRLFQYFEENPNSKDLLQGPLIHDDLSTLSSHWMPEWRSGMLGKWDLDPRALDEDADPFDIVMQGLGLFACVKKNWAGFNRDFRGFGGEEGYLHEKFRRAGGRTLCLPFLRWLHRFARPMGVPYPNTWEDRYRNYLIGHHELGVDISKLRKHMAEIIGPVAETRLLQEVQKERGNFIITSL